VRCRLAELDVLVTFAERAETFNLSQPTLLDKPGITIEAAGIWSLNKCPTFLLCLTICRFPTNAACW